MQVKNVDKTELIDQYKQKRLIEGLDSLRGILCLWVVCFHMQSKTNMTAFNFMDSFPSFFRESL